MFVYKNKHLSSVFFVFFLSSSSPAEAEAGGGASLRVRTSTQTQACKSQEPKHIRRPKTTGRGRPTQEQISQHLVTEQNSKRPRVFNTAAVFWSVHVLELNIQKCTRLPSRTKDVENWFWKKLSPQTHTGRAEAGRARPASAPPSPGNFGPVHLSPVGLSPVVPGLVRFSQVWPGLVRFSLVRSVLVQFSPVCPKVAIVLDFSVIIYL